jgi:hypothetical protein
MPPTQSPLEPDTYTFTPRELQRLAAYRAAVVAHFYTDQCDPIDATNWTRTYETVLSTRVGSETN